LCASGSGSSHAQPLTVMPTLIPRAMKTPARHTCCWERRAASAPVPHAERRADAACSFRCPLPPSPAAPAGQSPAKLAPGQRRSPALTRPCCGDAPGQPRSGFRGVDPVAGSDLIFLRQAPHRLFQQQQIRAAGPAQNRVAPAFAGPLPRPEPCSALVLGLLLLTRAPMMITSARLP